MSDLGNAVLTTEVDLSGLESGLADAEGQTQGRMASMAEGLKGSLGLAFAGIGVALAGALAGAGVAAFSIASDFNDAQNQMQAQLGITADEAAALGDVARDVFGNNFGASVEDVGQSIIEVRQQMKGLAADELQGVTEAALSLRDAFGFEVAESTNAANTLMEKFGLTSQQAFDFITKGQQAGLNTSGDFLESITEYGGLMADNGFEASEFFSIMESGLQGGVLGTDKAADAFKEFGIRMQAVGDEIVGPEGVLRGLMSDEEISQVFEGLRDGSVTVADAYDAIIPKVKELDDPIRQNHIGVALFGTMWEDMGADAMLALDLTSTGLADMEGATASLGVQYNNLGSVWEGATRQFLLALEPLGAMLLDLANQAMPYVSEAFAQLEVWLAAARDAMPGFIDMLMAVHGPIADLIDTIIRLFDPGYDAGAFSNSWEAALSYIGPIFTQLQTIIGEVIAFITSMVTGEGVASLGTWGVAFTTARDLIAGVMTAIMGIVGPILAILSAFWAQHGAEITAFATQAWNQIGAIVAGVLAILQATIIPILTAIGGFIASHSAEIQTVLSAAWTVISTVVGTMLANIQSVINAVLAALRGDWGTAWQEIQNITSRTMEAARTVVSTVLSTIASVWGSTLSGLQSKAAEIWGNIKGAFESGIGGILSYIEGLPGRFASAGAAMINSLRDGIMGQIGRLIQDAKNALAQLADLLPGSEPRDRTSPLYGLGARGEALAENFMGPAIAALEGMTLRPALAGIAGQLDAAMAGPMGGASARAEADVSVRLNEGGLKGLIDVQVERRLITAGREADTRRRTQ